VTSPTIWKPSASNFVDEDANFASGHDELERCALESRDGWKLSSRDVAGRLA
jgi:hypothetical protein